MYSYTIADAVQSLIAQFFITLGIIIAEIIVIKLIEKGGKHEKEVDTERG